MNKPKDINYNKSSKKNRLVFSAIMVSFPIVFFVFIEIILRLFNYGDNYSLFTDLENQKGTEYMVVNPFVGKKYFQKLPSTSPRHDYFLKNKPENGFRVFVMGSSSVYGFPYEENGVFTTILEKRLQDAYPNKHVEVINTAITAINSFTLYDYIDDILKESPDAVLIYAGHNEFYGAFGAGSVERNMNSRSLIRMHLSLMDIKIYQLLNKVINKVRYGDDGYVPEDAVRGTLMKIIAKNKEIVYHSPEYRSCMEDFQKNLHDLVTKATKNKIPVFVSQLVSNVNDLKPFSSISTDSIESAEEVFKKALLLEQQGNFEEANTAYKKAKDLDCIRFRATEEANDIIEKICNENNAHFVPMIQYFEEASPNGIIGKELMTEHIHPNFNGICIFADAFYKSIKQSGIPGDHVDNALIRNKAYYAKNWPFTKLDSLSAHHKIHILVNDWPFKPFKALTSDDYMNAYIPVSLVDSLAFKAVFDVSYSIYDAHLELAKKFKANEKYLLAFYEFYAAALCRPFSLEATLEAATCLMYNADFSLALSFFQQSLDYAETYYAYYNIAEIMFLKQEYSEAIEILNKADNLAETEIEKLDVMKKRHKIYHFSNQYEKVKILGEQIKKVEKDFNTQYPDAKTPYMYLLPNQVEDIVNKAYLAYKEKDFDMALKLFKASLDIKETSLANRSIGDILAMNDDKNALIYYKRAYVDYSNDLPFLYNLAVLYLQYQYVEKAKEVIAEMKRIAPDYKNIKLLEEYINSI